MRRYRCLFHGRTVGAIGVSSFQCVDVEAEDAEAARLRCYDTHEHITNFRAVDRGPADEYARCEALGIGQGEMRGEDE